MAQSSCQTKSLFLKIILIVIEKRLDKYQNNDYYKDNKETNNFTGGWAMNKTYFDKNNLEEMANFLINDDRLNTSDVLSIIRTIGNKFAQKHGIEKAKEELKNFKYPGELKKDWLINILTALQIEYIDFSDPINGEFTTEAFNAIF